MVHLVIKKGLNIPIKGRAEGKVQEFKLRPKQIALNLDPFPYTKFKLLVKEGDLVKIGQPLVSDKKHEKLHFVSPACGRVVEIRRGVKRRLINIVIELDPSELYLEHPRIDVHSASRGILLSHLLNAGLFAFFRQRPFNDVADPDRSPRSIFVKVIETAPFAPKAELHIRGKEREFQLGLDVLSKLTDGALHLCYPADSDYSALKQAKNVTHHLIDGPHPAGTFSVLIHHIDPILTSEDVVWTLDVRTVVAIGHLLLTGHYYIDKVIAIAGSGIEERGFFRLREGMPIKSLIEGRLHKEEVRLISGDPLIGETVEAKDFLHLDHDTFTVLPTDYSREFLHFFRLGSDKFTASRTYLSGFLKNKEYDFTTLQHGEHRPMTIEDPYEKVMPMAISVMGLIRALMAEDYDLAEELGLLEVVPEDFALPAFVCPSKVSMIDIVKHGQECYASDVLA